MSMSLSELSKLLRKLDICMLGTHGARGTLAARPMSNNKDVEYDGTSHFFTWADSRMARDIRRDPGVLLTFTDPKGCSWRFKGPQGSRPTRSSWPSTGSLMSSAGSPMVWRPRAFA